MDTLPKITFIFTGNEHPKRIYCYECGEKMEGLPFQSWSDRGLINNISIKNGLAVGTIVASRSLKTNNKTRKNANAGRWMCHDCLNRVEEQKGEYKHDI